MMGLDSVPELSLMLYPITLGSRENDCDGVKHNIR